MRKDEAYVTYTINRAGLSISKNNKKMMQEVINKYGLDECKKAYKDYKAARRKALGIDFNEEELEERLRNI